MHGGGGAAAWLIVNVRPAIVNVSDRDDPEFALTESVTVPFPLPVAPPVMLIQFACSSVVHAHPLPAVTVTDTDPPAAGTFWLVGEMV